MRAYIFVEKTETWPSSGTVERGIDKKNAVWYLAVDRMNRN